MKEPDQGIRCFQIQRAVLKASDLVHSELFGAPLFFGSYICLDDALIDSEAIVKSAVPLNGFKRPQSLRDTSDVAVTPST